MAELKLPVEEEELLDIDAGEPRIEDMEEDTKPDVPSEINILPPS